MMEVSEYKLHRRARMILQQLSESEQKRVLEKLALLAEIPVPQWPAVWATRLPGDQPVYLVRIDDSLRAFVRVEDGQPPEVTDVVRQETLDAMARAAGKNGN